MRSPHYNRRLAVDLASRGFGYAVLDAKGRLVDWGLKRVTGDKTAECMTRIMDLLQWYAPDVLVLEDCDATTSRRAARIRALAREIRRMATAVDVHVISVSWQKVRDVFGRSARATKDRIAARVVQLYPILNRHLPPKRRIWMSEDERMNMFDAIALGITARAVSGQDHAA